MCTGIEIAAIVGTALSTTATLYAQDTSKKQAEATAQYQADQAAADARAAQGQAQVDAEAIRKDAKRQRATAVAQAAAAGVDVNSPTALKIDETITKNAETDAYMTILNGDNYAAKLNQQGEAAKISGENASSASNTAMVGSLLSGATNVYNQSQSAWKRAQATT